MDLKNLVLTPPQMRTAELAASAHGVSVSKLMDNAGEALGRRILYAAQQMMKKNILLICGSGNNGGDGYVAADFLLASAASVTIVTCGLPKTDLAKAAFAKVTGRCEMITLEDAVEKPELIDHAEIIVDCVFGIGFRGELPHELQRFFMRCTLSSAYLIACDCPSGINCLSGRISPGAFEAHETLTFHKPKLGMLMSPAKEHCGRIEVADIGIGDYIDEYAKVTIMRTDAELAASFLPYRLEDSHKGIYGRVVMVCGSFTYPGAALIASEAALRSGVGIVNLCTHIKAVGGAAERMPECTYTPVDFDEKGFMTEKAADAILKSMERAGAAVIGCGLGKTEGTEKLVCELVRRAKCPLIIDADGINCLSAHIDVLKEKQTEIILTPHPAELARLCGTDTASVTQDMFGHACEIAEQYSVTVHAKNTQTLTVGYNTCYITDFGCSALAKGGSGDMLAGLIGGLMAQGIASDRACVLADYIMGTSARALCKELSPRGVLSGDIIKRFPRTFYELEHGLWS
ncbi:NAD(P)H-hydrate epimerase [Ruminococcaceae bacterium FB2012]|nr:NAD(P)H-hydrate epimerase [Ruminococcaceae bacterium FB2012]